MEDISPLAGGGIGALLGGVMTLVFQVLRSRTDPKLIDLMNNQQTSLRDIVDSNKLVAQELVALREDITGEIGEVRKTNTELRIQNAQQAKEIEGQARQIGILTRAQDSMRQDLRAQKAEFNKTHEADQDEIGRLKTCVTETEGRLQQETEDRAAMEIRVKNLEDDNERLRQENADLRDQSNALRDRIEALESKTNTMKAQWDNERAQLNHQLEEQAAQLEEKDAEIDRLREANATLLEKTKRQNVEVKEMVTS